MSLFSILNNFDFKLWKKEKNIIIDPLSCLVKLSILSLYPEGTKICISNNSIGYCNPNVLQGSIRFINGDAREDLHNLFKPIQKSIEWFSNEPKYSQKINILYQMCIEGLIKLKKCYENNSTIQHSIDYYVSYIKDNTKNDSNNLQVNDINNVIYDFIKNLWSQREINIIIDLFEEYKEKENQEEKDNILNIINNFTSIKEKMLNQFLKEQSSIL